jgi:tetratricopeptide (TPR) repeat protein
MADSRPSWQEILQRRQEAGFAGREAQLALFRENLLMPVEDERRRFVFSIHGDGGIGKTFLLGRLRQLARQAGRLCAIVDDGVYDVAEAMRSAAGQLERDGARLKRFTQRYEAYSRRQRDGGDRKGAQDGAAAAVTRATVRAGLGAARGTVIGGAITGALDPAATAEAVEQVREAAVGKMRRHDAAAGDSPAGELTEAFLAGLREQGKPIALFFDTYERTSAFLDGWLRDVLSGRHGDPPVDIIVVVAGRHALDTSAWSQYLGMMADVALQPFTEVEARQVLANKGVTDERVVSVILKVSGGLPLAVAMLAEPVPADPEAVGDVTSSVVERFLQWEEDPARREAVLAAALPRRVNQDVLDAVAGEIAAPDGGPGFFRWLEAQPFVSRHGGGCQFHAVVRAPMVRLHRGRSPRQWRERHARLAEAFAQWRDDHGDPGEEHWDDVHWQDLEIERVYHRLCADLPGELGPALAGGIWACNDGATAARKWTEMICSVGADCDVAGIGGLGARLQAMLSVCDGGDLVAFVDEVMRHPAFPASARSEAFRERGRQCRQAERYEEALAAFGRAIEINRENANAFGGRGKTYQLMGRYEDAVSDLSRAIELAPGDAWNLGTRGQVYRYMQRYEEALADLTRAVELDPGWDWALADRGEANRSLERYDDAIADFTQAIEIDPQYAWAIGCRGQAYAALEQHAEALADFTRALEISPESTWLLDERAEVYRLAGQDEEALADWARIIDLSPGEAWPIAVRGDAYRMMERHEDAVADLTRAVEIDPGYSWALGSRGAAYRALGRTEEALADFTRAIELDPEYFWVIRLRAELYESMDWYAEALADFTRAIELRPDSGLAHAGRGTVRRLTGEPDLALADFSRAIEISPGSAIGLAGRGETYRLLDRYTDALADLTRAIEINPQFAWAMACRGEVYESLGRREEALADYTRAIEIDPAYDWAIAARGRLYRKLGRVDAARADFTRAAATDPWDLGHADELAMMGLPRALGAADYQVIADVEVAVDAAGRESRVLLDWLRVEGILAVERGSCLPGDRLGYAPGPSWQASVVLPGAPELPAGSCGAEVELGRSAVSEPRTDHMTCPSCATRIALHHGDGTTQAWDLLVGVVICWADGAPDTMACPHCGVGSSLAQWRIHPPWAFGNLLLTFWNWPPLSDEFVSRVSQQLGHRVVKIAGSI